MITNPSLNPPLPLLKEWIYENNATSRRIKNLVQSYVFLEKVKYAEEKKVSLSFMIIDADLFV